MHAGDQGPLVGETVAKPQLVHAMQVIGDTASSQATDGDMVCMTFMSGMFETGKCTV
jgi:hypothetical protein